jgi:hypothetical protein
VCGLKYELAETLSPCSPTNESKGLDGVSLWVGGDGCDSSALWERLSRDTTLASHTHGDKLEDSLRGTLRAERKGIVHAIVFWCDMGEGTGPDDGFSVGCPSGLFSRSAVHWLPTPLEMNGGELLFVSLTLDGHQWNVKLI